MIETNRWWRNFAVKHVPALLLRVNKLVVYTVSYKQFFIIMKVVYQWKINFFQLCYL